MSHNNPSPAWQELLHRTIRATPLGKMGGVVFGLALTWYVVLGLYTEQRLLEGNPLPATLLEDFNYYAHAYARAIEGGDPYAERLIGPGFLYPPPALLLVGLFVSIPSDSVYLRNAVYVAVNIALLALTVWGIGLRYGYSLSRTWWWFPLAFGFAPVLELLQIGQINLITQFGMLGVLLFADAFPVLAGAGVTLAATTKVTPLVFFGYLIACRSWRAIVWGVALLGVAFASSVLILGTQPWFTYLDVFGDLTRMFMLGTDSNCQSLVTILHSFIRVDSSGGVGGCATSAERLPGSHLCSQRSARVRF